MKLLVLLELVVRSSRVLVYPQPVIAVNNGGPTESIIHEETGFLCESNTQEFASAMMRIVEDEQLVRDHAESRERERERERALTLWLWQGHRMGDAGRRRVVEMFSLESFGLALQQRIQRA